MFIAGNAYLTFLAFRCAKSKAAYGLMSTDIRSRGRASGPDWVRVFLGAGSLDYFFWWHPWPVTWERGLEEATTQYRDLNSIFTENSIPAQASLWGQGNVPTLGGKEWGAGGREEGGGGELFLPKEWSVSNFPCSLTRNITSHSMKDLAFQSLLRWKMVILPILTCSARLHFSWKVLELRSEMARDAKHATRTEPACLCNLSRTSYFRYGMRNWRSVCTFPSSVPHCTVHLSVPRHLW